MPEGPLLLDLDASASPPSGMVALHWRLQDGSWQDPSSWLVFTSPVPAKTYQPAESTLYAAYIACHPLHWHPDSHLHLACCLSINAYMRCCATVSLVTAAKLDVCAGMRMVH